jgi:hypothetical protein
LSSPWLENNWVAHTQVLLDSYHRWVGEQLIPRVGSAEDQARALFHSPFVVVSHGTQSDPILSYGNETALNLWEVDIMPSRLTAEPMHRDERAQLLERTTRDGYVNDYRGIRISSTGKRFLIEQATVWNLVDAAGNRVGQAATFSSWTPL